MKSDTLTLKDKHLRHANGVILQCHRTLIAQLGSASNLYRSRVEERSVSFSPTIRFPDVIKANTAAHYATPSSNPTSGTYPPLPTVASLTGLSNIDYRVLISWTISVISTAINTIKDILIATIPAFHASQTRRFDISLEGERPPPHAHSLFRREGSDIGKPPTVGSPFFAHRLNIMGH